ncbi:MAG TPA: cysteine desulfurase [Bacteroidetes bacterium]|nr:cysteine desulfurase [Bacteroidota bacterium]
MAVQKTSPFDPASVRKDFPILHRKVHGKPLIYFDNGATTQKPRVVIETMKRIYEKENSSIHRGVHHLSNRMTEAYEEARNTVRKFIGAANSHEIVFTSGTTGSINAVATSFGEKYVGPGDEVLVTVMEHHANLVPWQMLCEKKGAHLRAIPMNDRGELMLDHLDSLFTERTRILSLTHVSNALGTINPVKDIVARAHERNIPVMIDGAQAVQHLTVDVTDLDCDFYVFSGHKIYGPTGIGILYGKEKWLEDLPPYQYGGDMVDQVSMEKTTFNELPLKFEAGTTNYIGAIGLGKALEYLQGFGLEAIAAHENHLVDYATNYLGQVPGVRIYGKARERIAIFSFRMENIHPYDVGMILDKLGIAVRTGTHCAQPVMQHFGIDGTLRASLAMYNTTDEIKRFVSGLRTAISMLT